MLDSSITELADRMIQLQFYERTKQLKLDIVLVQHDAAMRGLGTSGAVVQGVYDLCARDLELRAWIVWTNLIKVLSRAGVIPSPSLADELKQAVSSYGDRIYAEPQERFRTVARNAGFEPSESLVELVDARERALRKIYAEVDLFVLGLRQAEQSQSNASGAVYNFYSPVGVVQTGPSATANVSQYISEQDREALIQALKVVQQSLDVVDKLPAYPKAEIVELVTEARSEAGKPRPNGTRLQSVCMAIATSIQTVGSLKPAYDTLKSALLPFGVQLP